MVKAQRKTLYIRRPVVNGADIIAWAKANGFNETLQPDDLHVTICFSRALVDWSQIKPLAHNITIAGADDRVVKPLGDKGAVVLSFENNDLYQRWKYLKETHGASWDYPDYHPHATITYKNPIADLSSITPYDGVIVLGPEVFEAVDDEWTDKITEKLKKDDDTPEYIAKLPLKGLAVIASIDDDIQYIAQQSGEDYINQLDLPAIATDELFGQVFDRAVEYAKQHAAELVTGIDDATREMIASEISASLEAGEGLDETIDRLQDIYAFSDERAELIARTEIGDANQHGALESMRFAQDYGLEIEKYWSANTDPCDDCQENEDASPIPLGEEFPSGDDAPLAHPHCECSLISVVTYPDGEESEEESDEE